MSAAAKENQKQRLRRIFMKHRHLRSSNASESKDTRSSSAKGSRSSKEFDVGTKIEARFGGRSRWFKGKITAKNRDGTYDILYNDGDRERRVKKELIRPL